MFYAILAFKKQIMTRHFLGQRPPTAHPRAYPIKAAFLNGDIDAPMPLLY